MANELELLGNRLKQARVNAGNPTIEDVAGKLRISKSYVSQMENGKKQPSWRHLIEFAKLYGTSVDALLGIGGGSAAAIVREEPGRLDVPQDVRDLLDNYDSLSADGRDTFARIGSLLLETEMRRSSAIFTEQIVRAMVTDEEWELIESARTLARAGDEVGARRIIDDWLDGRQPG